MPGLFVIYVAESHVTLGNSRKAVPLSVKLCWQANQRVTAQLLILLWLQKNNICLTKLTAVRTTPGPAFGAQAKTCTLCQYNYMVDSIRTLEGTNVRYSAGIIWSVSMFCTTEARLIFCMSSTTLKELQINRFSSTKKI